MVQFVVRTVGLNYRTGL